MTVLARGWNSHDRPVAFYAGLLFAVVLAVVGGRWSRFCAHSPHLMERRMSNSYMAMSLLLFRFPPSVAC